ncbi:hypothetical protein [Aeromonas veronii]|uniref:hypothetical protein n=1 Tax=Aeromonas veronii TaxID=654 RepID=UPI0032EEEBBA
MHSLSPYLFRCYNQHSAAKKREQRYSSLDNIKGYDLFKMLSDFMEDNSKKYTVMENEKQVYMFSHMFFDDRTREGYAYFNVGSYGMKTDIINVDTGDVDFEKAEKNAEIIKHFIYFFIPTGFNEGLVFTHAFRGNGIKTLFHNLMGKYFDEKTKLCLQMNPLAYENGVRAWLDGAAKEVKIVKFSGFNDPSDAIKKLGHNEQELIIKPPRKGSLGKLRDYLDTSSKQHESVELLNEFGSQVKTVIEIDGKKRTFTVGSKATNTVCEIEFDEDIEYSEGVPKLDSVVAWARVLVKEYVKDLYPGLPMGNLP